MPDGARAIRRIVVGANGTPGSTRAVAWVSEVAPSLGAEVIAVHVLTYDRELLRDLTPDTMRTWRTELAQKLRTSWSAPLVAAGVAHRCIVLEGETVTDVLGRVATEEEADLLVVGTGGHTGVVGRLLGSVTDRLSHHAKVPIVVVP
ncbi:MAG: universal stress protein [Acidimicrobiales bacterium]